MEVAKSTCARRGTKKANPITRRHILSPIYASGRTEQQPGVRGGLLYAHELEGCAGGLHRTLRVGRGGAMDQVELWQFRDVHDRQRAERPGDTAVFRTGSEFLCPGDG